MTTRDCRENRERGRGMKGERDGESSSRLLKRNAVGIQGSLTQMFIPG